MEYAEKLKDQRWQDKRREILDRDLWMCQKCFNSDTELHVHHRYYIGCNDPWDYPSDALVTLCDKCHKEETFVRLIAENDILLALKGIVYYEEVANLSLAICEIKIIRGIEDAAYLIAAITHTIKNPEIVSIIEKEYQKSQTGTIAKELLCGK